MWPSSVRALIVAAAAAAMYSRAVGAAPQPAGRLFAGVLLVRGSVAGGAVGGYGLYTKGTGDTAWSPVAGSRALTFGLGLFDNGRTRRYYVAAGNGVHRSTDGGRSWKILTSWRTEEILSVVPDPGDSARIYVSTPLGVFRTTDDGATWEQKMRGIPTRFVGRILMDSRDRRRLYAATETDLFVSSDGADHWKAMGAGLTQVIALLQVPGRPGVLIASGESRGLRRTTDGGATWHAVRGLGSSTVYALRASGAGEEIYAAGWKTGLWRSTDGGASWDSVWNSPDLEAVYCIFVFPGDPDHILLGTVGQGILESVDRGAAWRRGGLDGSQVKQIELYP